MLNLVHAFDIKGRELNVCDLIKCTFSIHLSPDTYEPVSFKVGMILKSEVRIQFE